MYLRRGDLAAFFTAVTVVQSTALTVDCGRRGSAALGADRYHKDLALCVAQTELVKLGLQLDGARTLLGLCQAKSHPERIGGSTPRSM